MDIVKNAGLVDRMVRDTKISSPRRVKELRTILRDKILSPQAVSTLCERAGTYDPFVAVSRMSLRRAIPYIPKSDRTPGGSGHAVTGQVLKEQLYEYIIHSDLGVADYRCGSQTLIHLFDAFNPTKVSEVKFSVEDSKRVRSERLGRISYAWGLTVDELLRDPSRVKDVRSRVEREKFLSILNIDDVLRKRMSLLDKFFYGNSAFGGEKSLTGILSADIGGMDSFGWIERGIRKGVVPEHIASAYESLRHPSIELSTMDERVLAGAVMTYIAIHRPFKRESIIGGYQEDLTYLCSLSDTDSIIERFGKPELSGLRHILDAPEITLADAVRVFDSYPMHVVRESLNGEYYAMFKKDVDCALEKTRPLFFRDGHWRDDSVRPAIPLDRLKKSSAYASLTGRDLRSLRDTHLLIFASQSKPEEYKNFFQSIEIQRFRSIVDDAVVAGRKLLYAEKIFEDRGVQLLVEGNNEFDVRKAQIRVRGGVYHPIEHFEQKYGFPFSVLVDYWSKDSLMKTWGTQVERMKLFRDSGVYSDKIGMHTLKGFIPMEMRKEE